MQIDPTKLIKDQVEPVRQTAVKSKRAHIIEKRTEQTLKRYNKEQAESSASTSANK